MNARIAMPTFAEDVLATIPVENLVAKQEDCPIGNEMLDDAIRKAAPSRHIDRGEAKECDDGWMHDRCSKQQWSAAH